MIPDWFPRLPPVARCAVAGTCITLALISGCERKERVIDIETPGADVEVDRDLDTGEVEVDVNEK
jgi:hypothetical protein